VTDCPVPRCTAPHKRLWSPERLPYALTRPATLVCLALVLHIVGRIGALCGLGEFDSFLYSVSAYQTWQPDATIDDLIPDKPAGQAVITGWCYRLVSGPPTRWILVPIESAFLIGAYLILWQLARRLFNASIAMYLMLFFVIAQNAYNVTDGFNLNECYLALPTLLAVYAHLTLSHPASRGFVRGLGIGLALTVKQTAIALPLVCLGHGLFHLIRHKRRMPGLASFAMTLIGIAVAFSPVAIFLITRGWLGDHVNDLLALSGYHAAGKPITLPDWTKITPLLPMIGWITLGATAFAAGRLAPQETSARHSTDAPQLPITRSSALLFTLFWFLAEAGVIWTLAKPWAHYWQQMAAPIAVLAGFGMHALIKRTTTLRQRDQLALCRWLGALTTALAIMAMMPMLRIAATYANRLDRSTEIKRFSEWQEKWSARKPGAFYRELIEQPQR